ncbi:histone protein [Streptomyces sp. NPDC127033]|uniref:histone protein n=1 Tax=Streptomyces sp. NPDC127033 TaxID=3347110 RepID=UPI00364C45B5
MEETKIALATAVLGGYVLGRTRKGRLALTVAMAVAGRGLGFGPGGLAAEGARRLTDVPQVTEMKEHVREQGVEAARGALSAVSDRVMGSLADTISGRTTRLSQKDDEDEEQEPEEEQEEAEPENESDQEDEAEEEEEEEEAPPARHRRSSHVSGGPAGSERRRTRPAMPKKSAPAKKKPSARKTSAGDDSAPAKKTKKTVSPRSGRRR